MAKIRSQSNRSKWVLYTTLAVVFPNFLIFILGSMYLGGDALNGDYISNHYSVEDPSPAIQKFVSDFRGRYNIVPDALAALGYDAMRVLADAIKRGGTTNGPKLRDAIAATKDFPGVTGVISINGERNAVKPAVVLKLQDHKYVYQETIRP